MCSFKKYFLSTCCVPIPAVSVGYTVMKNSNRIFAQRNLQYGGHHGHGLAERSRRGGINERNRLRCEKRHIMEAYLCTLSGELLGKKFILETQSNLRCLRQSGTNLNVCSGIAKREIILSHVHISQ